MRLHWSDLLIIISVTMILTVPPPDPFAKFVLMAAGLLFLVWGLIGRFKGD